MELSVLAQDSASCTRLGSVARNASILSLVGMDVDSSRSTLHWSATASKVFIETNDDIGARISSLQNHLFPGAMELLLASKYFSLCLVIVFYRTVIHIWSRRTWSTASYTMIQTTPWALRVAAWKSYSTPFSTRSGITVSAFVTCNWAFSTIISCSAVVIETLASSGACQLPLSVSPRSESSFSRRCNLRRSRAFPKRSPRKLQQFQRLANHCQFAAMCSFVDCKVCLGPKFEDTSSWHERIDHNVSFEDILYAIKGKVKGAFYMGSYSQGAVLSQETACKKSGNR